MEPVGGMTLHCPHCWLILHPHKLLLQNPKYFTFDEFIDKIIDTNEWILQTIDTVP